MFASSVSWLLAKQGNKEDVTVYGEKSAEIVYVNLFWGIVTNVINKALGTYKIMDQKEIQHFVQRFDL